MPTNQPMHMYMYMYIYIPQYLRGVEMGGGGGTGARAPLISSRQYKLGKCYNKVVGQCTLIMMRSSASSICSGVGNWANFNISLTDK